MWQIEFLELCPPSRKLLGATEEETWEKNQDEQIDLKRKMHENSIMSFNATIFFDGSMPADIHIILCQFGATLLEF